MTANNPDVGIVVKEKLGEFWSLTKKAFRPKTPLNDALDEALSNKNWGSKGSTKVLIARATNDFEQFGIVMNAIFEAFKSPPSKWRLIFKAVCLCEYVVENGNERVVEHVRMRIFALKNLADFTYKEGVMDRGVGVREKAKEVVELLGDNKAIRRARNKAKKLRSKLGTINTSGDGGSNNNTSRGQRKAYDGHGHGDKKKSQSSPKSGSGRASTKSADDDFSDDDGKIQIKFNSGGKSYGQHSDDDDFNPRDDSAPAEASGGEEDFDPFGEEGPAPAPAPAPTTSDDGWDNFNPRSEPASAPAADDDWADFSTAPKATPPADDLFSVGISNPPASAPTPAPAPIDDLFAPAPATLVGNVGGNDPFGEFTSAPAPEPTASTSLFDTPAPAPAPAAGLAVAGFDGLVSLDGLAINSEKPKAPAPAPAAARPSGNPYGAVTNAPLSGPPMGLGFPPAPQYGGARPPMGMMGGFPQQQWGGYPQQQQQPNAYAGGYPQQHQHQQPNPYGGGYGGGFPQQQQPYGGFPQQPRGGRF